MKLLFEKQLNPPVYYQYDSFEEVLIYELPPQFRTVNTRKGRSYIFFPYMQFFFLQHQYCFTYNFYVTSSKFSLKTPNNTFYKIFSINHFCLGDQHIDVKDPEESADRFWQTKFNSHVTFMKIGELTRKHGKSAPGYYPTYKHLPELIVTILPRVQTKNATSKSS